MIYLDYNASAPLLPSARQAMMAAFDITGNPSSLHHFGRQARGMLEQAREDIACVLRCQAAQIIFTSGASEANNMALGGFASHHILASAGEHPSVLQKAASHTSFTAIPLLQSGVIDLDQLAHSLSTVDGPKLISVMLVNNETGVIQPIDKVVALARHFGALVHCDGVQAFGRLPLDMSALGVDMLSVSSHKIGGPKGMGALVLREGLQPQALIKGGGQERSFRAGTENVMAAFGFAAAVKEVPDSLNDQSRLKGLRDDLERNIKDGAQDAIIFGDIAPRVAQTSCLSMPGVSAALQVMDFDLQGIAISSGSACSSGKSEPSHVLKAMGYDEEIGSTAVRISLGRETSEQDIKTCYDAWKTRYFRDKRSAVAV